MRVFVTGGTGFVGSRLLRELKRRGHEVVALVRSPKKAEPLRAEGLIDQIVAGDLDDGPAIKKGVHGAAGVVHVAGLLSEVRRGEFGRTNVDGTRRVLEASAEAGVSRLVFVSSIAAAGPGKPGKVLTEDMPCAPVSAYGLSKLSAEALARAYRDKLEVTIVRPPVVYGPGDTNTLLLFKLAKLGLAPTIASPEQLTSLVHVEDLARGLADALLLPGGKNELFYMAERAVPTTGELLRSVGAALGKPVRLLRVPKVAAFGAALVSAGVGRVTNRAQIFNPDKLAEMLGDSWGCSSERARTALGWSESESYVDGFKTTVAWYREHGWL